MSTGTKLLELSVNGDPYGSGYTASEYDVKTDGWFYRGDIGAQTRAWWRRYAKKHGFKLRECK